MLRWCGTCGHVGQSDAGYLLHYPGCLWPYRFQLLGAAVGMVAALETSAWTGLRETGFDDMTYKE